MRELTFVKPRILEWHDAAPPRLEGPRQAIVAPVAATTCDLDRSLIKGRTPYEGPIALGHEFAAQVVDVGDAVRDVVPGDTVVVPAQISCGDCARCRSGATAFCRAVGPNAMYGFGAFTGSFGGGFSDLVRVPFADAMLVRLPDGVSAPSVAAAGDNLTNPYEAVVPHLVRDPGANVLIAGVGGTGFYAVQIAKAMGAGRVDYVDHDPERLALAARLGAGTIEIRRELTLLLRSLAPRGVCTSMAMYFRETPLPLLQMMLRGVRFEATPTNIRAFLPAVLSLVGTGRIAPERVTTEVLPWETLPEALVEPSMKPVFVRSAPEVP
jgi:alcohol dehydrogenase